MFVASSNSDAEINSRLDLSKEAPKSNGPFNLRLISLPQKLISTMENAENQAKTELAINEDKIIDAEENFPNRTSLNLKGDNPRNLISLIKGNGPLQECLACLQMLAEYMKLPYRRDSIEKALRDSLRRGITPSMPMLGLLISGMGLHASGAKIPSNFSTRLNVPCLVKVNDGFGLIIRSDANGLLIADPKSGWTTLHQTKYRKNFQTALNNSSK